MRVLTKMPSSKGSAERFTGDVWLNMLVEGEASRLRVGLVRFAPNARTAWHRHATGQTLYVTDGTGLAQSQGGEVIVMRAGDTVYTPPNEWHWHGAAAEQFMSHLAMSEVGGDTDATDVEWGEHVADADYQTAARTGSDGGNER
jgi:quercetin dioxygenase-like cupin family protein